MFKQYWLLLLLGLGLFGNAAELKLNNYVKNEFNKNKTMTSVFDDKLDKLFQTPRTWESDLPWCSKAKPIWVESVPYRGKTTRFFACYGLPEGATPEEPVPGVVLVHGGGATAAADWVALWNRRGYAAIAMDTCGTMPCWAENPLSAKWPRHSYSGPAGWGRMEEADLSPQEQWPYHAVSAVILSHSLLRSLPGVDSNKIGLTGISWGGVLTCIAAGLDDRFRFAISVYGCGFFNEKSSKLCFDHPRVTEELRKRWFELWDPGHYLARVKLPILFFSGSNDPAYPFDALSRSFRTVPTMSKRLGVRVAYPHNHTQCHTEETIFDFADAVLNNHSIPSISEIVRNGNRLMATVDSTRKLKKVELNFTRATGYWSDRHWNTLPVKLVDGQFSIEIPRCATAAYFTIYDYNGCCYSSPMIEID